MYVHIIYYEFYLKNSPEEIQEKKVIAPCAASGAARIWFWQNLPNFIPMQDEVDSVTIRQVQSHYVRT